MKMPHMSNNLLVHLHMDQYSNNYFDNLICNYHIQTLLKFHNLNHMDRYMGSFHMFHLAHNFQFLQDIVNILYNHLQYHIQNHMFCNNLSRKVFRNYHNIEYSLIIHNIYPNQHLDQHMLTVNSFFLVHLDKI